MIRNRCAIRLRMLTLHILDTNPQMNSSHFAAKDRDKAFRNSFEKFSSSQLGVVECESLAQKWIAQYEAARFMCLAVLKKFSSIIHVIHIITSNVYCFIFLRILESWNDFVKCVLSSKKLK